MNRYKTNKQAFIIAVLVILLCLACLTGATLALFTSDANDGTIGIITTSGDVEVDIVDDSEENPGSLIGDYLKFQTDPERDKILFEPGATFYTQGFRVKNIGDVLVKFRMYISNDKEINMQEFEKAFELWITKDPKNLDQAEKIHSFTASLAPGHCSDVYYLVVRMKESADNSFQEQTYDGIGITVYAVQGNVDIKE